MPNPQRREFPQMPGLRGETLSLVEGVPRKSKVLSKAKESYQIRPRTYEAALTGTSNTEATVAPAPFNISNRGE